MSRVRVVVGAFLPAVWLVAGTTAIEQDDTTRNERSHDPPIEVRREQQPRVASAPVLRGGHRSVQVNVDLAGNDILGDAANEPSLAVDPADPRRMVIGWRQFDTVASDFRQAGWAYSGDGGRTWNFPGVLEPGASRSDPVVAADADGTFFYYSLETIGEYTAQMFRSTNGGTTWTGPFPAYGGDKIWMNVDTTSGPGRGQLYATWTASGSLYVGTDFTRSTDGGFSYDAPLKHPGPTKWGTLDVGPGGELYLVGASTLGTYDHYLVRSSNARNANEVPMFDLARPLDLGGQTTSFVLQSPNPGGLLGQVWVAVDRSAGATRGHVYVLASVDSAAHDPLDLMFIRSTDGGQTWSPPRKIDDSPTGTDCWQWFGTLAVAPDGRIDVVWNDSCRHDGASHATELRYAYSTDAGTSWSASLPVTPAWNPHLGYPGQNEKIGDYYHMVSDLRGARVAYAATLRGAQDVYFVRAGDCNANGSHDSRDISAGSSGDCDADGVPDECEEELSCPACDDDGSCGAREDCLSCPGDCPGGPAVCGNGLCEPPLGEDCLSCAPDCAGEQGGPQAGRFCCGDGAGANPVGCADARCNAGAFSCGGSCCGNGVCEGAESGSCTIDCPGDLDGDGVIDSADCASADADAFAVPPEVRNVALLGDKTTLVWSSDASVAGLVVGYDVVRGRVDELPVGTGASETCVASGLPGTRFTDPALPSAGEARYYLVRAADVCGAGGWGSDSSTTVCD